MLSGEGTEYSLAHQGSWHAPKELRELSELTEILDGLDELLVEEVIGEHYRSRSVCIMDALRDAHGSTRSMATTLPHTHNTPTDSPTTRSNTHPTGPIAPLRWCGLALCSRCHCGGTCATRPCVHSRGITPTP